MLHFGQWYRAKRWVEKGSSTMMENEYAVDITDIKEVVKTADVMLFRFAIFDKRLLFDARSTAEVGPMLRVVGRAGSASERFRHLKKLRPQFPLPKNIVSIAWPKYVSSLKASGVWQTVVDRCAAAGFPDKAWECEQAFQELLGAEQHEIANAICGEGYETLWSRAKETDKGGK